MKIIKFKYTVEQLSTSDVSECKYELTFKSGSTIPINIETKVGQETANTSIIN